MTDANIELIRAEIARLSLQPGDVVVVTCPMILPWESRRFLQDYVRAACGTERLLILDGGIRLEVVSLQGSVK